ncbi:hypothetical protein D9601_19375 [Sphingomonas sp. MA1305]|uniref:hypothetical protein n=1 Tax=Sphingomonas sp. MA1305 TaxID=2479204 RepID=UPI0018E06342|nr:hypothetical protein [Sphingomonas sp. MA1305]MBI0477500.1 hypothetical protein [Sphingomonas sp. MA1305]
MAWISGIAWFAVLCAAGCALIGGGYWLSVARTHQTWTQDARFAAKFTGYAMILAASAFIVIGALVASDVLARG